jgi:hypothetical protein
VSLLLGGDFRRRVDVERLRVAPDFVTLDLRAVDDFLVPAAFVPDRLLDFAVDDFARVERRVLFVADADLRVDAAFVPVDFRRVVFAPDVALARDFDAPLDFRLDADDLRFFVGPRSVNRLVSPARTVVAFSSCATPFATSSCARATALSTGLLSFDRFDLVFFRAAIALSRQFEWPPSPQYELRCKGCVRKHALSGHKTPPRGCMNALSRTVRETETLRTSLRLTSKRRDLSPTAVDRGDARRAGPRGVTFSRSDTR